MNTKSTLITIAIAAVAGASAAFALNLLSADREMINTQPTLATRISKLELELSKQREQHAQIISSAAEDKFERRTTEQKQSITEQKAIDDIIDAEQIAADEALLNYEEHETSRANTRRQNRKRALISGGFSETEANWVLDNESQIQLEELFEQHQIRRAAIAKQSESLNPWVDRKTRQDRLREKLGEESFEKYLKANGWPTSANVQNVLSGSPAEQAGLKAGDQITSYAGKRVYNLRDVNRLTLQGNEGESVLIEVERDGNQVQVTLPRGPIGVSGG